MSVEHGKRTEPENWLIRRGYVTVSNAEYIFQLEIDPNKSWHFVLENSQKL